MIYLASPFTHFYAGPEAAFIEAARIAGRLTDRGVRVFSPIVHSYPLAKYGDLDMMDPILWQHVDAPFITLCSSCFVAMMPGWLTSEGVRHEINEFEKARKPIFYLDPLTLELETTAAPRGREVVGLCTCEGEATSSAQRADVRRVPITESGK